MSKPHCSRAKEQEMRVHIQVQVQKHQEKWFSVMELELHHWKYCLKSLIGHSWHLLFWEVGSKSCDKNSTSLWWTTANHTAIQAVSQWSKHQPTIQHPAKQTVKLPAIQEAHRLARQGQMQQGLWSRTVILPRTNACQLHNATNTITHYYSNVQSRIQTKGAKALRLEFSAYCKSK